MTSVGCRRKNVECRRSHSLDACMARAQAERCDFAAWRPPASSSSAEGDAEGDAEALEQDDAGTNVNISGRLLRRDGRPRRSRRDGGPNATAAAGATSAPSSIVARLARTAAMAADARLAAARRARPLRLGPADEAVTVSSLGDRILMGHVISTTATRVGPGDEVVTRAVVAGGGHTSARRGWPRRVVPECRYTSPASPPQT